MVSGPMSYQDQQTHLNPLSQIPLMKSPFIQFPQAITLPYNYAPSPPLSSLPNIPDALEIPTKEPSAAKAQLELIESAEQRLREWEKTAAEARLKEARRLAPGFLDTGVTMLVPTMLAQQESVKTEAQAEPNTKAQDYSDQFASLKF